MSEIPQSILLLKFGANTYTHEGQVSAFNFEKSHAEKVCAEFKNRGRDLVIDYEHQTLHGAEAPAAGWIDELFIDEEGVHGHVKSWTERALEYLESGEYRYFSPVILSQKDEVTALHSVALTNHPAIHGIQPLVNSDIPTQGSGDSALNKLCVLLDVAPESATLHDDLSLAVSNLQARAEHLQKLCDMYGCASDDALDAHLKSLHDITQKHKENLADVLIQKACAMGKLVKSQVPFAQKLALNDYEAFQKFIEILPRQTPGSAEQISLRFHDFSEGAPEVLTESQLHILRASGCSESQIQELIKGGFHAESHR